MGFSYAAVQQWSHLLELLHQEQWPDGGNIDDDKHDGSVGVDNYDDVIDRKRSTADRQICAAKFWTDWKEKQPGKPLISWWSRVRI